MRLLLDDKHLKWEQAWDITTRSLSYTNHTLLPEALEKWGLDLFGSLLPRHLELIYEINRRFLQQVRMKFPGNDQVFAVCRSLTNRAVRQCGWPTLPQWLPTMSMELLPCTVNW